MARPNDTRMPGKKFGSDAGGGEVKPRHRGERVAGRAKPAAATKPGARQPCLAEKERSLGRQIVQRIRKKSPV